MAAPPRLSTDTGSVPGESGSGSSTDNEMAVVLRNNGTARILYGYSGGDTTSSIVRNGRSFLLMTPVMCVLNPGKAAISIFMKEMLPEII